MSKSVLNGYIPIAKMIAKTFGRNCEVVIHDLSTPKNSVVYVVNNHVTGREIGQSFDHLIKNVLISNNFDGDYASNYTTYTKDGRKIKSSTALIRNEDNEAIGAMCINFDFESVLNMKDFLDDFVSCSTSEQQECGEYENVTEIVDGLIDKIIGESEVATLKKQDKISLIKFMYDKGVFLIKGSIEKVANQLNISPVTVYSYIDEIKHS